MMRALFLLTILFLTMNGAAQTFSCTTTEAMTKWFSSHPELKEKFVRQKARLAEADKALFSKGYKALARSSAVAAAVYTIPVVFHILHQGGSENISDAQVQDAVKILNADYQRLNADTNNVVVQFKNIIGNAKFAFALANRDPNGICTNGIIRHWDVKTNWTGDFNDYIYTWPHKSYLNIYVVKSMGGNAAGYTYLPGSGIPDDVDVVVVLSNYIGSIGSGNPALSRVLTHETGHWFDLEHTWGFTNSPGVACGDDGVGDTPVTKGYTSCSLNNAAVCTGGVVENVQNFMEYAYCDRMFTVGQTVRMQAAINNSAYQRNLLSSPANLSQTGITAPANFCVPQVNITAMPGFTTTCVGKTLTLKSFTYNANPDTYSWTANNGAIIANPGAPVTTILFPLQGMTTVTCTALNAFGGTMDTLTINVLNGQAQITSGQSESFEIAGLQLPQYWKTEGFNGSKTWRVNKLAGSHGSRSVYIAGDSLPANAVGILESPSYDFKSNPNALFTFKWAYARKSTLQKDIFKVQASMDCGGTWTDVWWPNTTIMANSSGGVNASALIPQNYQWVLKNLTENSAFVPFANEDHVTLRFYFEEDQDGMGFGNRLYLDEINFVAPVGVNELTRLTGFKTYPNPASGNLSMEVNLPDAATIEYQLRSVTGTVLRSATAEKYTPGRHTFILEGLDNISPGIYLVNFSVDGAVMCNKVIIE
jgi:hypothetical protein